MKKDNAKTGNSLKKRLTIAGASLAAVFASAAAVIGIEYNGYAIPFWDDSRQVLCDIDPTCRHLTEGEIELAQTIYGDSIDYENVLVFSRPYFAIISPATGGTAMSPNGNIYVSSNDDVRLDYSRSDRQGMYVHEMGHVWQDTQGVNLRLAALELLLRRGDYMPNYYYILTDRTRFSELNIEEQARLLQLLHEDSNRLTERWPEIETEPPTPSPPPPPEPAESEAESDPDPYVPPEDADMNAPANATDREVCDLLRRRYNAIDGAVPALIPCLPSRALR